MKQLALPIFAGLILAGCGGTTEETINYETSNGTILWSKHGPLVLAQLAEEQYFYGTDFSDRINNRGTMEIYRTWLDGRTDISHTFQNVDASPGLKLINVGTTNEAAIATRRLYLSDVGYYQLFVDSVAGSDGSAHSFSKVIPEVNPNASFVAASGAAAAPVVDFTYGSEGWRIDADSTVPFDVQVTEPEVSFGYKPPVFDVTGEHFQRSGRGDGVMIYADFYITTFDPYARESVQTYLSAYDLSDGSLVWQRDLGRQNQAPSGGFDVTNDLIIVHTINDDVPDGCSATAYTYSLTGSDNGHRIDCGPGTLRAITGQKYLTLEVPADADSYHVRRFNADNTADGQYTLYFGDDWDSVSLTSFTETDDGRYVLLLRTYRDNLGASSPWGADIDYYHQEHVLILNPDMTLNVDLETLSFRTVKRERMFLPDYYVYMDEATPAWNFTAVHQTSTGVVLFEGEYSLQEESSPAQSTYYGVLH